MSPTSDGNPTREELWAAMRRDSQGMRELQGFLESIKEFDDAAFAEATEGSDRSELMELLERLNHLLGELDKVTAQLHPDVN